MTESCDRCPETENLIFTSTENLEGLFCLTHLGEATNGVIIKLEKRAKDGERELRAALVHLGCRCIFEKDSDRRITTDDHCPVHGVYEMDYSTPYPELVDALADARAALEEPNDV